MNDKSLQDTLAPCPWCGKQPELGFSVNQYGRSDRVVVLCRECDLKMYGADILWATEEQTDKAFQEVAKKWNRRAKPHEQHQNFLL